MSSPANGAAKPDKTMSSRLLTMKFMQRAAASKVAKEAAKEAEEAEEAENIEEDGNDNEQTENQNEHTPKRARKSMDRRSVSGAQADLDLMSAAMAEEDQKRREAMTSKAAAAGESHWSFNYPAAAAPSQRFVMADESLDTVDESSGRRGFGGYVRKKQVAPTDEEVQEAKLARVTKDVDELIMEGQISRKDRHRQIQRRMNNTGSTKGLISISGGGSGGGGPRKSMGTPPNRKKRKSGD